MKYYKNLSRVLLDRHPHGLKQLRPTTLVAPQLMFLDRRPLLDRAKSPPKHKHRTNKKLKVEAQRNFVLNPDVLETRKYQEEEEHDVTRKFGLLSFL